MWGFAGGFTEKVECELGRISAGLFGSDCKIKSDSFSSLLTLMEQHFIWREQYDQARSGGDCQSIVFQYMESIKTSAFFLGRQISSERQV